ncbi:MAG: acyl-CoA dehydrogenase family protein [Oligoflexales bacterium]|nr:acyl-CoA dehydrogenase family protein [Oligoflexales bacterium]
MDNKKNFFTDTPDLEFFLRERSDFKQLFQWISQEERDAVGASNSEEYLNAWIDVLKTFGEIVGTQIAPNQVAVEKEPLKLEKNGDVTLGPALSENVKVLKEFGVGALGVHPKFGGMGAPFTIESCASEMISRACPSTGLNVFWYGPIAHIVDLFGTDKERELIIPKAGQSEWSGNMALTEAEAGSDLTNIRTYGVQQADGTWQLFGSKRFITNGSSEYSLVLAQNAQGSRGLKSLCLFLCFRKTNSGKVNYQVSKLEEKLGIHGSATCELEFNGSEASLLGKNGEGFNYMLQLMNDARLGVTFQGLGFMEGAFRLARDYAHQRQTWGKPIAHHEMIAEKLLDMEIELTAMRSLAYQASHYRALLVSGEEYLRREKNLSADEISKTRATLGLYKKRLRRWTPLLKWWSGEKSQEWARVGLLIHGGYGYTTEYRAEFWYRESAILAIYEGTSQIQSLMALKDTMKELIRNPQKFIEIYLGTKMRAFAEGDHLKKSLLKMRQVYHGAILAIMFKLLKSNVRNSFSTNESKDIRKIIKILSKDLVKFENLRPALLHAERLCEIKAWLCLAESLYLDAQSEPSRTWIAERFISRGFNRMNFLKIEIETDEAVIMNRLKEYDSATSSKNQTA